MAMRDTAWLAAITGRSKSILDPHFSMHTRPQRPLLAQHPQPAWRVTVCLSFPIKAEMAISLL